MRRAAPRAMVNIPRALLESRTGAEPRYHMSVQDQADRACLGKPMAPLKGNPGVMRRPRKKKPRELDDFL